MKLLRKAIPRPLPPNEPSPIRTINRLFNTSTGSNITTRPLNLAIFTSSKAASMASLNLEGLSKSSILNGLSFLAILISPLAINHVDIPFRLAWCNSDSAGTRFIQEINSFMLLASVTLIPRALRKTKLPNPSF